MTTPWGILASLEAESPVYSLLDSVCQLLNTVVLEVLAFRIPHSPCTVICHMAGVLSKHLLM